MRSYFPKIIGNALLRRRLGEEITEASLPHAYILEGAVGSGRRTLALQIAAALSCEHRRDADFPLPCGTCLSCRKILSGNSPDVIRITRGDKATLGVEAVRDLRSDVCIAPNDTEWKVYIIEDAHLMTLQAQNAFLLTLEEPPPYVIFLLLCDTAASLLETVRSRAPVLRTESIYAELLAEHLCSIAPEAAALRRQEPREFDELILAAGGSIGQALQLLNPKARRPILAKRRLSLEFVETALTHRGAARAYGLLYSPSKKREELTEELRTLSLCLRDLLLSKQSEHPPLCFFTDREEAAALAYRFTAPELLTLCRALSEAEERLSKNANLRLTVTALLVAAGML